MWNIRMDYYMKRTRFGMNLWIQDYEIGDKKLDILFWYGEESTSISWKGATHECDRRTGILVCRA